MNEPGTVSIQTNSVGGAELSVNAVCNVIVVSISGLYIGWTGSDLSIQEEQKLHHRWPQKLGKE